MSHTSSSEPVRRLVLVPATAPGRDDELVRRYRLARLRLIGREGLRPAPARRSLLPPARGPRYP